MLTWFAVRAVGFIYYEFAINALGQTVGAVSRRNRQEPYTAFYCDGHRRMDTRRGSFVNARKAVVNAAGSK